MVSYQYFKPRLHIHFPVLDIFTWMLNSQPRLSSDPLDPLPLPQVCSSIRLLTRVHSSALQHYWSQTPRVHPWFVSSSCSVLIQVLWVLPANILEYAYFSPSSYHPPRQAAIPSALDGPTNLLGLSVSGLVPSDTFFSRSQHKPLKM